jgi:hypothetical protein
MYASAFVLGFHGCDESVGERILRGEEHLTASNNNYDWLGGGIYFWENSPERALHWANFIKDHPTWFRAKVERPFVVGAILDLGRCLDLMDAASLTILKTAFGEMKASFAVAGAPLPNNEKGGPTDEDLVKRKLDCAVINYVHSLGEEQGLDGFDSVRGAFWEGTPIFDGSRIMDKTHIQICIRDPRSIRGYFRPILEED